MAKYYIDPIDQSNSEELQTVYTNAPTVSYVINSDDSQHAQSIIVGNDQYMVLDQNTITLQNQFEIPAGQQQIYYMETDENIQGIEAIQSQPVIMNSTIPQNTTQKLIMVQQTQPSMIIQQPQILQRPIHKAIQPRVQAPQQVNVTNPPRLVLTNQVRPGTNTPRPTIQTRINIPRNPLQRTASPIQRAVMRPQLVPALVQRGPARPQIRAGVIQNNTPSLIMQGANKNVITRTQFTPKDGTKVVNASVSTTGENLQTASTSEEQSGGGSTVISIQEYQQLLADRKRAAEQVNKMMNRNKNLAKKGTIKMPLTRPTPAAIQTQVKPQLLVNEEESARLEKEGKRHQNARIIKPKDNNRLPGILRNFVPPPEIRDIINKTQHTLEFKNSIRMFVIHESGEQRLITFTMPKEDCTIQEILEQVGVPIAPNTKIAISETNTDGINLVVSVGIPVDDDIPDPEPSTKNVPSSSVPPVILNSKGSLEIPPKVVTPELSAPQENEIPKYIHGMLAVCTHCGFLSDDFNKCIRCKSKLPDGIKAVSSSNIHKKGTDARVQKPTIAINLKNNGNIKPSTSVGLPKKKMKPKVVDQEPVILTLSSDDEDADESQSTNADQQQKKVESQISISIPQEPSLNDFKENGSNEEAISDIKEAGGEVTIAAKLRCRTIRIGSYNIQAPDEIVINTNELILSIPSLEDNAVKTIKIPRTSVVKVLANFQKLVPVIFYYVAPSIGEMIRNELHMTTSGDHYFDPISNEETYKRITLLLESVSEETKWVFTEIYGAVGKFEELNVKDANIVLVKSSPRPIVKPPTITQASAMSSSEVRQLLIYPPGITGGLPINTEDYLCLAQDQFLNDVIIDFYLKYLVLNLPKENQDKIHVFSTFFYKRLTTKPTKPSRRTYPAEMDPLLSAAQKRHSRVKSWTKNVNLFEKDYVIVPINENAHWFLAIICFPGMNGAHTFDGKPYKIEQIEHKKRMTSNLNLRQMKIEKAATVNCDEGDLSDKDEAEGDESELDSNDDSDDAVNSSSVKIFQLEPIKQPCILIFDSLAGASRARVVATLRDYLTCEHKIKQGTVKVFNKDVIKGACPKIPQQTNYTDCGLYLLQYVESFLQDPVKDYRLPISTLKLWFNELTVTKKREDISNLIKSLMIQYKKNVNILPILQFPTLNGELVESHPEDEEEEEEPIDEEEECDVPKDELESENENVTSSQDISLLKPSESSDNFDTGFMEEPLLDTSKVKPDIQEVPTVSNRDTMSYLKSKRIIKHRVTDVSEAKKMRMAD